MNLRILIAIPTFFVSMGISAGDANEVVSIPVPPASNSDISMYPKLQGEEIKPPKVPIEEDHELTFLVPDEKGLRRVLSSTKFFTKEQSRPIHELVYGNANSTLENISVLLPKGYNYQAFEQLVSVIEGKATFEGADIRSVFDLVMGFEMYQVGMHLAQHVSKTNFLGLNTKDKNDVLSFCRSVYQVACGSPPNLVWAQAILQELANYLWMTEMAQDSRKLWSSFLDHFKTDQQIINAFQSRLTLDLWKPSRDKAQQFSALQIESRKSAIHKRVEEVLIPNILSQAVILRGQRQRVYVRLKVESHDAQEIVQALNALLSNSSFKVSMAEAKNRSPISKYQPPRKNRLGPWFLSSGFANETFAKRRLIIDDRNDKRETVALVIGHCAQCAGGQCLQAVTCGCGFCCGSDCQDPLADKSTIMFNACCDDRLGTLVYHSVLECSEKPDLSPERAVMRDNEQEIIIEEQ